MPVLCPARSTREPFKPVTGEPAVAGDAGVGQFVEIEINDFRVVLLRGVRQPAGCVME